MKNEKSKKRMKKARENEREKIMIIG